MDRKYSLLYQTKVKKIKFNFYFYRCKLSEDHYHILKDSFPISALNSSGDSFQDISMANMTNLFKFYFSNDKSK